MRSLVLCLVLALVVSPVTAADPPATASRAKAALEMALAVNTNAKVKARARSLAKPETYDEARARAVKENLPLVVYVGCAVTWRADKAVTVQVKSLEREAGPIILVAFNDGKDALVNERLKSDARPTEVETAITRARNAEAALIKRP